MQNTNLLIIVKYAKKFLSIQKRVHRIQKSCNKHKIFFASMNNYLDKSIKVTQYFTIVIK